MTIRSIVVHGEKLGRKLGFPTANLSPVEPFSAFRKGVYAVYVRHKNKKFYGVMNIGTRPTIARGSFTVEVHILDFDLEIYGEELEVEIVSFIRSERKFNSLAELQTQISEDILASRGFLQNQKVYNQS